MTVRHQGGGHKTSISLLLTSNVPKDNIPAKVATIRYDPNRSSRILLLNYADGEKRYILAPNGLKLVTLYSPVLSPILNLVTAYHWLIFQTVPHPQYRIENR